MGAVDRLIRAEKPVTDQGGRVECGLEYEPEGRGAGTTLFANVMPCAGPLLGFLQSFDQRIKTEEGARVQHVVSGLRLCPDVENGPVNRALGNTAVDLGFVEARNHEAHHAARHQAVHN